jgi:pimeloyl-ACP methyl ester carboxylesterase
VEEPLESKINLGEVELCVYEWPGEGDPILLLHATGFHSRCWNEVVLRLPGQHIYAVDIHFHGGSSNVGDVVDWVLFAKDICLLIAQLGLNHIVGVGHSMGGHLVARAAASMAERFKQLVLIDPVIFSPQAYEHMGRLLGDVQPVDHPVARRKNNWRDADEMFQRFRERAPFDSWRPEALRDYCDYALLPPDEDGFRQLACNPINEASNYLNARGQSGILELLPRITPPATVLRAPTGDGPAPDFSASPTWPELASALPLGRDIYLPELNHFIPMQAPDLVARYILEALEDRWQHAITD